MATRGNDSMEDAAQAPLVLGVLTDLFFGVKIAEAARRAGGRMQFVKTAEDLMAAAAKRPALIVFDLQQKDLAPAHLIGQLHADPATRGIPTLAFFSHVQEELRREALAAGCDRVLPRSTFTQQAEVLVGDAVRRALSHPPPEEN